MDRASNSEEENFIRPSTKSNEVSFRFDHNPMSKEPNFMRRSNKSSSE